MGLTNFIYQLPIVVPPSGLLVPDFSEYWLTDPGSAWRNSGVGAPPNTNFDGGYIQVGTDRFDPIEYFNTGPDNTGFIRMTVAATATNPQAQMNVDINQSWLDMWFRGVRRGDFNAGSANEDLIGKFMYHNTTSCTLDIDHTTMTGHQTGVVTGGDMTYNSSTGRYEGTITAGLGTLAKGTALIFTSGPAWSPGVALVDTYDSGSGAVTLYARGWTSEWLVPPPNGSAFKVYAQCGESVTFSAGGSGHIGHISTDTRSAPYTLTTGVINNSGFPVTSTTGTLTFSSGITVGARVREQNRGARSDFQSTNNVNSIGTPATYFPANNQTFSWFPHTQGGFFDVQVQTPMSPWNLASNALPFVTYDHSSELLEIKFKWSCSSNPWRMDIWLTNEDAIDVHGVADGETYTDGGGVHHFNNAHYMAIEVPNPPETSGFNIQWGSYCSGSLNSHIGDTQDIGFVEKFTGLLGGADPFNSPFVRNPA